MYIDSQYINSLMLNQAEQTSNKTLADYLTEEESGSSSDYFSDAVSLSPEAYAAIKEYKPEMLESLGYEKEETTSYGTSSLLDNISLSDKAIEILKKENPEFLESLGYKIESE